jgi:hypothetical protein
MVCKLDIEGTLPELQHEFCGLWNHLVDAAQTDTQQHHVSICTATLKNIRKLFIALHDSPSTPTMAFYTTTDDGDAVLDNPKSYPMCTIDGHRPFSVPDLVFDVPAPNAAGEPSTPSVAPSMPTPTPLYPPGLSPTFTTPVPTPLQSALYQTSPSQYGLPFVDPRSYVAGPPSPGARIPFHVPQVTRSHAPDVPRAGNVRSPPLALLKSVSSVPSIYLDAVSTSSSDSSGGHAQTSRTT